MKDKKQYYSCRPYKNNKYSKLYYYYRLGILYRILSVLVVSFRPVTKEGASVIRT